METGDRIGRRPNVIFSQSFRIFGNQAVQAPGSPLILPEGKKGSAGTGRFGPRPA
jgi:hypothetical protein